MKTGDRKVTERMPSKELLDAKDEIAYLKRKLNRCRTVMECNDPTNAREIFGGGQVAYLGQVMRGG